MHVYTFFLRYIQVLLASLVVIVHDTTSSFFFLSSFLVLFFFSSSSRVKASSCLLGKYWSTDRYVFFSSRDGTVLFAPPTNCFYRGLAGYLWKSDQGVRGFDKFSTGCRLGLDLIFFRNMRITTLVFGYLKFILNFSCVTLQYTY